jgi:amino acid adenylation domain-containing protein
MAEPTTISTRHSAQTVPVPLTPHLPSRGNECDASPVPSAWNWKEHLRGFPRYAPISRQALDKAIEPSSGQQRIWFVSQLDSGSIAYNVPLAWRLTGALNVEALEWSLNEVVRRHEALRTCFPSSAGRPVQWITEQPLVLTTADLRSIPSAARDAELHRHIQQEIRRTFDLSCDLMLRAALFRLDDEEYLFVLTVQHIASDGAAMGLMLQELSHFYSAIVMDVAPSLAEPLVQYRDFAAWQEELLTEPLREKQLAYWKQQLMGVPAALDLPSDYSAPSTASFRGGIEYRVLSKELTADFKQLARRHGVTGFMALLAALDVLLYRYTGQADIVVGASMTHRTREETARSIGFFANMMALRTGLHDDPEVRDLLKRVRGVALGAYDNQDVPFETVVAELQPERTPGRNPLFQVMLNVEDAFWHDLHLAKITSVEFPVHNGTTKFDLTLSVVDRPEGFQLALEYNSDLLEARTARRMLGHFETLLGGMIADPGCRVSKLPLLSEAEREPGLVSWNQTAEDFPSHACVHHLFEAQVQGTPDAIAIGFGREHLSYRDLNTRANRLARHLVKRGVGPEVLVGICVERSLDLVITILGILKAGGAYVPLDPSHPPQRRIEILREGGVRLLLTQEAIVKEMPGLEGIAAIRMDADQATIGAESDENLPPTAGPENLAYVIHTSGSTGRPKGVQIEHRGVVNFLSAMQKRPGLSPHDVVLAIATISFDVSVLELLLPLTLGARVVIASREEVTDGRRLLEALTRSGATVLQATPTSWNMLLAAGWKGSPYLKAISGGEVLSHGLADQLVERCASVWNVYGPTETTVWSFVHEVDPDEQGSVPIGRPIPNMRAYVLDSHRQPVPLGVPGELYIGGVSLGRGYLGSAELTADKFVSDPFSNTAGARLYRTGDLVRERHDGSLEFLSRVDRQVKIRGHRIEPAEIEATLARHPSVQQVAVAARDDASDGKRLVAYLVPKRGADGDEAADSAAVDPEPCQASCAEPVIPTLRRFLRDLLPEYMIPSAFVLLETLPKTASGKLDLRALPAPDDQAQDKVCVSPRDSIEARLVEIWEQTLDVHPISVTDNFFDVGGHSVLGARLFAQIEKEFGKRLPLSVLFQAPTVEQIAAILREEKWSSSWLVQIQAGDPSKPPFFFVHARMGYRALAAELGSDQPVYVVPYDKLYENQAERSIQEMAVELTEKIRQLQPHGPYYLGGVCLAGRVAYAIAREMYRQGEEVGFLAVFDAVAPGYEPRSRMARLRFRAGHLKWNLEKLLHGGAQQKRAFFKEMSWHLANRVWWASHGFFRWIGRPLPGTLRQDLRLTAHAVISDPEAGRYPGRVSVFRPAERPKGKYDQPALGWNRIAAGGVDVFEVPGDHKHLLLPPNVSAVAQQLRDGLRRAQTQARDASRSGVADRVA